MLVLGLGVQLGGKGGNANQLTTFGLTWSGQTSSVDITSNGTIITANNSEVDSSWTVRNIHSNEVVTAFSDWEFKFQILDNPMQNVIGISRNTDTVNNYTDIDHGINFDPDGNGYLIQNNVYTGDSFSYTLNDQISLIWSTSGSTLSVYKNGLYVIDFPGTVAPSCHIKVSLYSREFNANIIRILKFE